MEIFFAANKQTNKEANKQIDKQRNKQGRKQRNKQTKNWQKCEKMKAAASFFSTKTFFLKNHSFFLGWLLIRQTKWFLESALVYRILPIVKQLARRPLAAAER
jgi:hypothetical protein